MRSSFGRMLFVMLPLTLIGMGMLYWATQTDPADLTDDGYSLKYFYYAMGAGFTFFPLFIAGVVSAFSLVKRKRIEDLMVTGKQGTAVVLELNDTGTRINDNPRVDMLLEISIEGLAPYKARKKVTVPMINLSQVQVGQTIGVFADPNDPANQKRIAIMLK